MNNQCDVLILTSAFGMGHNSVAKAIEEQLLGQDPALRITTEDIMTITNPKTKDFYFGLYNYLTSKQPKMYNKIYKMKRDMQENPIDRIAYQMNFKTIADYIKGQNPKLIVSTFPLGSGYVSRFKEKYDLDIPLVTSITDVVDSWEWIHRETDLYLVPCREVKEKLIMKGIGSDSIKVTGIPVKSDFLHPAEEKKDHRQILIMGGVMNALQLDQTLLKKIDALENIKTTIVTGNNQTLYEKLTQGADYENIQILGYTTEIAKLMSEADLMISKPGCITLFEAINKGIPIIIKNSNVGQEEENIKFIKETQIGIVLDTDTSLDEVLMETLNNDTLLDDLKANIEKIRNELEPDKVGQYTLELM